MSKIYLLSSTFWAQTAERAAKTFCQAAAALLASDSAGLISVDWKNVASVAGLAALVSVLTSIGSGPFGPDGTPSLVQVQPGVGVR